MLVEEKEVISLLKAKKSGTKGWYSCREVCPYCKKENHLAIIFGKISSFVCKRCDEKGTLFKLLKELNRLDLVKSNQSFTPNSTIPILKEEEPIKKENFIFPLKNRPLGFKRIYSNDYLESRGFTRRQFEIFEIGITSLDPKVRDTYVIFILKNDDNECIGWLARSIKSKEEIDFINKENKKLKKLPYLRWINSEDTDFSKFIFGINEVVINKTTTMILVEGITSKSNVDNLLSLYDSDEIKCGCSFGKNISIDQIKLLKNKNIKNIIVLQDPDAIKETKQHIFALEIYFNVEVGFIPFKDDKGKYKDPGNLNLNELLFILNHLQTPLKYYLSKTEMLKND